MFSDVSCCRKVRIRRCGDFAEGVGAGKLPSRLNHTAEGILLLTLSLCIIEGAIRKWLIGEHASHWSSLAYFSKDIAFGLILVLPGRRADEAEALVVFKKWLVAGVALLIVGILLSSMRGINVVGGALTLRATVLLPVLAYFGALGLGRIRVSTVAWLVACLAAINCGMGIVQNRLPSDHELNRYVAADSAVVALETGIRATGTFSYITGLEVLALVGFWAGLVLMSLGRGAWEQTGGLAAIIAGLGCGLVSVSRAPIVVGGLMVIIWVWCSRGLLFGHRNRFRLLPLVLVLLFSAGLARGFIGLGRAVLERHLTGGDTVVERAFGQIGQSVDPLSLAPFGVGFGSEQIAGNYASSGTMGFKTFEEQLPRLILEAGVFGMLGFLIISFGAILALQTAKRMAAGRERGMLLATQLLLLALFYTNVVYNHVASCFAWVIFAAVLGSGSQMETQPAVLHGKRWRRRDHFCSAGVAG